MKVVITEKGNRYRSRQEEEYFKAIDNNEDDTKIFEKKLENKIFDLLVLNDIWYSSHWSPVDVNEIVSRVKEYVDESKVKSSIKRLFEARYLEQVE